MRSITIIAADGRRYSFGGHGRLEISKRLLAFWLGRWPSSLDLAGYLIVADDGCAKGRIIDGQIPA
jgi:hypothetical protein